jgi:hypothetical protein
VNIKKSFHKNHGEIDDILKEENINLNLSGFFRELSDEKKRKEEEFNSLFGELELNSLFEEVSNLKKEDNKKRETEQKTLQQFESFLYSKKSQKIKKSKKESISQEKINLQEEKSLGLLAEPSNIKQQKDTLTPLNQKFATLDDLQKHYNLFLNRIQQQLSTLGGGGETRLRYLDDIVGIATNSGAYNNKFLQWNSITNKAEFVDPNDVGGTTIVNISGITTYYQASNTDDYIGVNADVPVTIVLPQIPSYGKKVIVKDEGNKIATYNITVQAGAGTSVENDSSVIMTINHQSFTYFYNGNNWFLI